MAITIWGIVKDGRIVPSTPLPEGTQVEVRLLGAPAEVPAELQAELSAWQQASAEALEGIERLAHEIEVPSPP